MLDLNITCTVVHIQVTLHHLAMGGYICLCQMQLSKLPIGDTPEGIFLKITALLFTDVNVIKSEDWT